MIDQELLDVLVCPVSQAPLKWSEEEQGLVCKASNLVYPVRNGIPVLLPHEARELEPTTP
ncbi:MAG TPA: Trm112 family protein [Alcanivoracaceae bacterium]|nr:Trm112 family protein [Alcanivoracaceae bacterium]